MVVKVFFMEGNIRQIAARLAEKLPVNCQLSRLC